MDATGLGADALAKAGVPACLIESARSVCVGAACGADIEAFSVTDRGVVAARDLTPNSDVWFVPASWTFSLRVGQVQLKEDSELRSRIAQSLKLPTSSTGQQVFDGLWRFALPTAATDDTKDRIWLLPARQLLGVEFSAAPNISFHPVVCHDGCFGVLVWPTRPIDKGSCVVANWFANAHPSWLWPEQLWRGTSGDVTLPGVTPEKAKAPNAIEATSPVFPEDNGSRVLKYCTDSRAVQQDFGHHPRFAMTTDADEADIMWLCHHKMRTTADFPNASFVSQLPEERFFVNKGELAHTVRAAYGTASWMPESYVCPADTLALAQRLLCSPQGTYWIVKAPALSLGVDMFVTGCVGWVLRVVVDQPDRVVQEYVLHPTTLCRKKFDVRYFLVIRSLVPLEAFVHKTFVVRTAEDEYAPEDFGHYDRHFTIPRAASRRKKWDLDEFFDNMEADRPGATAQWKSEVEPSVHAMLRELCIAIQQRAYTSIPRDRFRGMYAADVLIDSNGMQPKLLEVNYSPDNTRICKLQPSFLRDTFEILFLHQANDNFVKL
jgi:tubulin--tyrosine ligase-like protein 12